MRYPNTRYGNPNELLYYAQGRTVKEIAKQLRRSEKSVYEWMNGGRKIPFWVPELLRLRHMETQMKFQQMRIDGYREQFGTVKGTVIQFDKRQPIERIPDNTELDSLPDFEQARYAT